MSSLGRFSLRATLPLGVLAALTLAAALPVAAQVSNASGPRSAERIRPVVADCVPHLPSVKRPIQIIAVLRADAGRGFDLDLRASGQDANSIPWDALAFNAFAACLSRALDLPDPNQHGAWLITSSRINSRAPGLDASVRADVDDSGLRAAPPMPALPETFRASAVRCMQFIGDVMPQSELHLAYLYLPDRWQLQRWSVRGLDPGTIDGRESFQLHARCMTGALGNLAMLSEATWADGVVTAQSR